MLKIRCNEHPKYTAAKSPSKLRKKQCPGCELLYILRWQHSKEPDKRLGSINPYQFLGDLEDTCAFLDAMP